MLLAEGDEPGRFLSYAKKVTLSLGSSSRHGIKADKLRVYRYNLSALDFFSLPLFVVHRNKKAD